MQKLLTAEEMAEVLQVKLSTIYKWTHEGFVPHVKLGKLVRFRESEVLAWLEKRSEKGRVKRRLPVIS